MACDVGDLLHCYEYFVNIKRSLHHDDHIENNVDSYQICDQSNQETRNSNEQFESVDDNIPLWLSLIIDILEETISSTTGGTDEQNEVS